MARRILLLVTDLQIGGTPTVVRELARRLRGAASVEVACLAELGPVGDELVRDGVRVTAFGARSPAEIVRVVADLIGLLRDRQIDTVLSFLLHANTVAAAASLATRRVRYIQSIQTTQPEPRWHWHVQGLIHRRAEKIVVPSESVADLAEAWSGVPRQKLVVIPNAIDPADFTEAHEPSADGGVRVGFLGRLDPVKRVGDLVEAMRYLPPSVRLEVYGHGPQRAAIELAARQHNVADRVTLHGAIARPQEALREMGVLVLPSDAEGFGLVLIEAMAAGVPVVATNVPGIRDVVRDGQTGLLVPPRSPAALAGAIARLAADEPLRRRLVAAAKEDVAARFTWPAVLEQYCRVLEVEDRRCP
jgi:glycosyltransferase involved in cell wall biosynthesis